VKGDVIAKTINTAAKMLLDPIVAFLKSKRYNCKKQARVMNIYSSIQDREKKLKR